MNYCRHPMIFLQNCGRTICQRKILQQTVKKLSLMKNNHLEEENKHRNWQFQFGMGYKNSKCQSERNDQREKIFKKFDKMKEKRIGKNKFAKRTEIEKEITRELGVSKETINNWKRKFGQNNFKQYSREEKLKILEKFEKNPHISRRDIAAKLNVSQRTFGRWIIELKNKISENNTDSDSDSTDEDVPTFVDQLKLSSLNCVSIMNWRIQLAKSITDHMNIKNDRYLLAFYVFINPMDNEFVPDENDGDPSDDQPYTDEHVELDNIRSMFRFIKLMLFEPNFSNRYLINLGSLEPQGLCLDKNRRNQNYSEEQQQQFLGHAPLTKINEENGGPKSQQTELTEYRLSIPIDLTPFFKHKIWEIELRIYHQYEESKYSLDSLIASRGKKPLIEGQIIIKLHTENGGNFVHMFHKECINEWFVCIDLIKLFI
uniref:Transposase n=1 Tax=Globodera rostochiensis TaxID=31243 RepID=A0A914HTG3_GLORO